MSNFMPEKIANAGLMYRQIQTKQTQTIKLFCMG